MYSAIVFLPLLGCLVAGLFGHLMRPRVSEVITSGLLVISALLSIMQFFTVLAGHVEPEVVQIMPWIVSGDFTVSWALRIDTLTSVMFVVVTLVSSLVHIYSIGYMSHDPHRPRFFAYLSLFTFAMLMLVSSNNFLQLFFGWEGVGLASYLLIGFWYNRPAANAAAIKAFVVNRIGDFGFILGIFAIYVVFGSLNFDVVFAAAPSKIDATLVFLGTEFHALNLICLLLFMGAMGKSAQFLLHTWLPDAMEGPTPVSALIHAATMVTAGVFLLARCSPLYELAPIASAVVIIIGASTAFFAATIGLVQNDIKRVIAYSTCSQLGYMFVAAGVGAYSIAIFHLFTHAFFKALLFLGAGSVIHAVGDEQDMRKMGGLRKHIPKTYWLMIIGTLALTGAGVPGLIGFAGFYSKDAIIEAAFGIGTSIGDYAFWLLAFTALLTSFYSWRLIHMTFHGKPRASDEVMDHIQESSTIMLAPLLLLGLGAAFAGMIFAPEFIGHDYQTFWGKALYLAGNNHILDAIHQVPLWVKVLPFIMMVSGFAAAWWFYLARPQIPARLAGQYRAVYTFLLNKWYFDELYDFLFVRSAKRLGRMLWKGGDGFIIDGFGPDGVSARVLGITQRVVRLQSGYLYHYAFAMIIGVAGLVTWFMFTGI